MKIVNVVLILLIVLSLMGCSKQDNSNDEAELIRPIVKVSVLNTGKILIDGTESTLSQIEQHLKTLKTEDGVVWYYRETGQEEAPQDAMQVIQIIVENGLPISLSSNADFSDYIGEDGLSHPR